jgi:hypothetical protein
MEVLQMEVILVTEQFFNKRFKKNGTGLVSLGTNNGYECKKKQRLILKWQ